MWLHRLVIPVLGRQGQVDNGAQRPTSYSEYQASWTPCLKKRMMPENDTQGHPLTYTYMWAHVLIHQYTHTYPHIHEHVYTHMHSYIK